MTPIADQDLIEEVSNALRSGLRVALATIVRKEGSGPRRVGAKIAVFEDGRVVGTLGGGPMERHVVNEALRAIKEGTPRTIKYSLAPGAGGGGAVETGLICGGVVEVFIDVLKPKRTAFIFGVGRIGSSLTRILKDVGFKVVASDVPDSNIDEDVKSLADEVVVADPRAIAEKVISTLREGDFLIVTHGRPEYDYLLVKAGVSSKASYIELLGSRRKVAEIVRRLVRDGVGRDDILRKLRAPAGIDVGAESPGEISVSIAAEVVALAKGVKVPKPLTVVEEILREA